MVSRLRTFIMVLFGLFLISAASAWAAEPAPLPADGVTNEQVSTSVSPTYSEFLSAVERRRIRTAIISGRRIEGEYTDGFTYSLMGPESDPALPNLLYRAGVNVSYRVGSEAILSNAMLILGILILIVAIWQWRRQKSGGKEGQLAGGPGKSGAQIIDPNKSKVTFADVAGMDEVKADLEELVDFLKHPDRYTAMGARIPKGVMLYGPPGTGKTLLARAVAGEAGVAFIHFSASQFVEVYVGVGASRVRDLFAQARKHAPCIIFIDELDAVGRHRGSGPGGNDEREQTLNQLLVEMDGFENSDGIIVMAATNRVDILDRALLRPGRFDRQVPVDAPDLHGRRAILNVHAAGKIFDKAISMDALARRTPGFTGADLANLLNEAALQAVRAGKDAISITEIEEAMDRVLAGGPAKSNRIIMPDEKRRVAVHEAGHAVAARLQTQPDPVHKVTIIPRGRAGGFTVTMPEEDKTLHTRSDLFRRLVVLLAGRAAEELLLGEASTGCQDDLNRAFALAQQMVSGFGMNDSIGPVGVSLEGGMGRSISEELAAQIDREARSILQDAAQRVQTLLDNQRPKLNRVVSALIDQETLDGRELDVLLGLTASAPQLKNEVAG